MNIVRENDKILLSDESRGIDCYYQDGKIRGTGSRKYKSEIQEEIASFVGNEVLSDIDKIKNGELNYGNRELASYASFLNNTTSVVYSDFTQEELSLWQKNPVKYNKKLRDLSMYFYGQKGILARTYDLYKNLHDLESSLWNDNPNHPNIVEYKKKIRKFDKGVYKKPILRDVLFSSLNGTCIGYLLGKSSKRDIQILDLDYYIPYRRINGYWQVRVDLSKFFATTKNLENFPQEILPESIDMSPKGELRLQPLEVRLAYDRFVKSRKKSDRLYSLNITKTFVIKINSEQDERLGRPLGMPAFDDLRHKDMIRKAEDSIIDKIVNFMLVLKLGNGVTNKDKGTYEGTASQRQQMYNAVKNVLNTETDGLKLFGLPFWVDLEPIENNLELFDKTKYEAIDSDIATSLGVQGIFGGQSTQTYASGDLGLQILFKNVFSIIEQIEQNLFNKQYALLIDDAEITFKRNFNRSSILDPKVKIEVLQSLQDKGGSIKYLLDMIGVQFDPYLDQTRLEQDVEGLDLHNIFVPYATSFTQSDEGGRPDEGGNSTENNTPSPSD